MGSSPTVGSSRKRIPGRFRSAVAISSRRQHAAQKRPPEPVEERFEAHDADGVLDALSAQRGTLVTRA